MPAFDRRAALCEQPPPPRVTGIDFVQVVDPGDQRLLRVFFLIDPDTLAAPMVATAALPVDAAAGLVSIVSTSGGESVAEPRIVRLTWMSVPTDAGPRTILEVEVAEPGDFSIYRLTVDDARVDRGFNGVAFSFKQGCPSELDCAPTGECPEEDAPEPRIDYLARDFTSFGNALLDFAAAALAAVAERDEAEPGVMLMELFAALGDEFSYIQDRYAREAYLATATEGRGRSRPGPAGRLPAGPRARRDPMLAVTVAAGGAFAPAGGAGLGGPRERDAGGVRARLQRRRPAGGPTILGEALEQVPLHPPDDTWPACPKVGHRGLSRRPGADRCPDASGRPR